MIAWSLLVLLGRRHRKKHRHRARDQNDRVGRAHRDIQHLVRFMKHLRVKSPENSVGHEEASEHQHFSDEENPHPLLTCFELIVRAREVMGVMVSCVLVRTYLFLPKRSPRPQARSEEQRHQADIHKDRD